MKTSTSLRYATLVGKNFNLHFKATLQIFLPINLGIYVKIWTNKLSLTVDILVSIFVAVKFLLLIIINYL